jgi:hypothetical protein
MRNQDKIYCQDTSIVRNKTVLNVNTSSDMCIFETPSFKVIGASKIDCTNSTGTSYIISTATTIPLLFEFANPESVSEDTKFKYEIYKYKEQINAFTLPAIYQSEVFAITNFLDTDVSVTALKLDGEYLIKGYFESNVKTDFFKKLGKTLDTLTYRNGSEFNLYDSKFDYHFIALKAAETPTFNRIQSNVPNTGTLYQQVILPTIFDVDEGEKQPTQNTLVVPNSYAGNMILTLNGMVLAKDLDYTLSTNIVTLNGEVLSDDVFTAIYAPTGGNNLIGENILVKAETPRGVEGGEGNNKFYFNTTSNKYEIYTTIIPADGETVIVMLNGITLANGLDHYGSTSNQKRIILEGDLRINDILTLVYFGRTNVVNGLKIPNPTISWSVKNAPEMVNGYFSVEVCDDDDFINLTHSGVTNYVVGQASYLDTFDVKGVFGSKLYYRVKNVKNYKTFCGDVITSVGYSEVIPLVVETNSINAY